MNQILHYNELRCEFTRRFRNQDERFVYWLTGFASIFIPPLVVAIMPTIWSKLLVLSFYICFHGYWGRLQWKLIREFKLLCSQRCPERINLFSCWNPLACRILFLRKNFIEAIRDAKEAGTILGPDAERHLVNLCLNRSYRSEFRKSRYFLELSDADMAIFLEYLASQEISERTVACIRAEKQRLKKYRFFDQIVGNESFLNS